MHVFITIIKSLENLVTTAQQNLPGAIVVLGIFACLTLLSILVVLVTTF